MLATWTLSALALSGTAVANTGGKWTPDQLLEHDPNWLREIGLEIPPEKLWTPGDGGVLEAIVRVGGCSAGLISAEGLVITNHHCIYGILQEHSTPERDLIRNGFLATSHADELPAGAVNATVPNRFTDVTAEIEAAVPAGADDFARYQAIEAKKKELIRACETTPHRRCDVASYDDGVRYQLIEMLDFADVRLVWAPPGPVGEYGGEIDNWMWPRHAGDFALVRLWANPDNQPAAHDAANRPYEPRRHLEVSTEGVTPDQFVMVAGYPGRTYRSLVEGEMKAQMDFFAKRAAIYPAWMDIYKDVSTTGDDARIAVAGRLKGLANREKNARGQLEAIARGRLVEKKADAEAAVLAWAADNADHRAAVDAHRELEALSLEAERTATRDFLLGHAPLPLDLALDLVRWASEREKADADRDPDFQERNRDRLRRNQIRNQSRLWLAADQALMVDWLERLHALDDVQKVPAVEALHERGVDLTELVHSVLDATAVLDQESRLAMFEEDVDTLRARQDPLIDFAFAIDVTRRQIDDADKGHEGAESRLRPVWRRAVAAHAGKPIDPDANATLRVSLAHIKGYSPRDAVFMTPQTTLAGKIAKHTGEAPFDAPEAVRAAAPEAPQSPWADKKMNDVTIDFLATGDTTGGSSGSPVLDGQGRLVGANFDRVWENIANDFGYNPEIARNVSVDVRYLFWLFDVLHGDAANGLREEMGIR
ncbi:MAG: S46 family peptidase [Acidobacteriota bacterium]